MKKIKMYIEEGLNIRKLKLFLEFHSFDIDDICPGLIDEGAEISENDFKTLDSLIKIYYNVYLDKKIPDLLYSDRYDFKKKDKKTNREENKLGASKDLLEFENEFFETKKDSPLETNKEKKIKSEEKTSFTSKGDLDELGIFKDPKFKRDNGDQKIKNTGNKIYLVKVLWAALWFVILVLLIIIFLIVR